jgi:hypothetical protein
MRNLAVLFIHLIATLARLLGFGGVRSLVAESLLLKHQLLIVNRSRQRSPNLSASDRILSVALRRICMSWVRDVDDFLNKAYVVTQIRPSVVTPNPAMSESGTLTPTRALIGSVGMSNVLSEEKKQQVIALGKLGWPLRRIEQATGVRRETASAYLKSAGVVVCLPGWGRRAPAKPAMGVTTDPESSKPANEVTTDPSEAKPAIGMTTDFGQPISPPTAQQDRATSACEP